MPRRGNAFLRDTCRSEARSEGRLAQPNRHCFQVRQAFVVGLPGKRLSSIRTAVFLSALSTVTAPRLAMPAGFEYLS